MEWRTERDSLGDVKVPAKAYYGAQTQRAIENFPVSGLRQYPEFIRAYSILKKASARANLRLGKLDHKRAEAIIQAAEEVISGKRDGEFLVDAFQAGAGTSTNMNLNEVIANRAEELLGGRKGQYKLVHPNDHVNMSQSTNDTYHAATHIAVYLGIRDRLVPALKNLEKALERKGREFENIEKSGRTHMQDAMPLTLGQEFSGYRSSITHGIERLVAISESLKELSVGGTAVGTGANAPAGFGEEVVKGVSLITRVKFRKSKNFFNALQNQNVEAEVSGGLRTVAISLNKICNDFILLSSGPNTGIGEISLPAVQPGSSIMPGKVNPSIPEMVNMVCFRIHGNDLTVSKAASSGQLELNVYLPVIAYHLLDSVSLLANGISVFSRKCVAGIRANPERIRENLERNPLIAAALAPRLGYSKTAEIIRESYRRRVNVRQVILERKLLAKPELDRLLRNAARPS